MFLNAFTVQFIFVPDTGEDAFCCPRLIFVAFPWDTHQWEGVWIHFPNVVVEFRAVYVTTVMIQDMIPIGGLYLTHKFLEVGFTKYSNLWPLRSLYFTLVWQ